LPVVKRNIKAPLRKGARRMADIPPAILRQLNRGEIECISLVECLAVDFASILKHSVDNVSDQTLRDIKAAKDMGWLGRTKYAGEILYRDMGLAVVSDLAGHTSDQVRGWAAMLVTAAPKLSLKKRLALVKPLADDPNPGVREVAWIALRPFVAAELESALELLQPWTESKSGNIRRYACEITRPRGVWCAHITALRNDPAPALPLLAALREDPSRYVQNSVANWLNDASKDNPAWVKKVTQQWQRGTVSKETAYICKRALRTLNKK
jgi:3-methyladenine DNA glycosylase AlkC